MSLRFLGLFMAGFSLGSATSGWALGQALIALVTLVVAIRIAQERGTKCA